MQYNNPSYKHAACLKIIIEIIVIKNIKITW